jgi:hypothetical protein
MPSVFDDDQRRKFLAAVKETVHEAALDNLASKMASIEFEGTRNWHVDHEIIRINRVLERMNVRVIPAQAGDPQSTTEEGALLQFQRLDAPVKQPDGSYQRGDLEIGGRAWDEAREFWRKEVLRQFPKPPKEAAQSNPDSEIL